MISTDISEATAQTFEIPRLPEKYDRDQEISRGGRIARLLTEFGEARLRAETRARDSALAALLLESEDSRRKKSREALELNTEASVWAKAIDLLKAALEDDA